MFFKKTGVPQEAYPGGDKMAKKGRWIVVEDDVYEVLVSQGRYGDSMSDIVRRILKMVGLLQNDEK